MTIDNFDMLELICVYEQESMSVYEVVSNKSMDLFESWNNS